eukprot:scaffold4902_cov115-Cylindrotheca_fusiformis.AAC.8
MSPNHILLFVHEEEIWPLHTIERKCLSHFHSVPEQPHSHPKKNNGFARHKNHTSMRSSLEKNDDMAYTELFSQELNTLEHTLQEFSELLRRDDNNNNDTVLQEKAPAFQNILTPFSEINQEADKENRNQCFKRNDSTFSDSEDDSGDEEEEDDNYLSSFSSERDLVENDTGQEEEVDVPDMLMKPIDKILLRLYSEGSGESPVDSIYTISSGSMSNRSSDDNSESSGQTESDESITTETSSHIPVKTGTRGLANEIDSGVARLNLGTKCIVLSNTTMDHGELPKAEAAIRAEGEVIEIQLIGSRDCSIENKCMNFRMDDKSDDQMDVGQKSCIDAAAINVGSNYLEMSVRPDPRGSYHHYANHSAVSIGTRRSRDDSEDLMPPGMTTFKVDTKFDLDDAYYVDDAEDDDDDDDVSKSAIRCNPHTDARGISKETGEEFLAYSSDPRKRFHEEPSNRYSSCGSGATGKNRGLPLSSQEIEEESPPVKEIQFQTGSGLSSISCSTVHCSTMGTMDHPSRDQENDRLGDDDSTPEEDKMRRIELRDKGNVVSGSENALATNGSHLLQTSDRDTEGHKLTTWNTLCIGNACYCVSQELVTKQLSSSKQQRLKSDATASTSTTSTDSESSPARVQ